MTQTATKPQPELMPDSTVQDAPLSNLPEGDSREWQAQRLRLLWDRRRMLRRAAAWGLAASTVIALLIPNYYTSTSQLMPPDSQSASGMAMMAAMFAKGGGASGIGSMASDLLGLKTSGAMFIGVLRSQTSQDRLVQQFELQRVYGKKYVMDARTKLDENTSISEDRKSGIITVSVTDRDPQRAAALTAAYIDQLNSLVTELSTSAAHRERVFLDERLKVVKQDLDGASDQLAQFSSKNNTLDLKDEGKAIVEAAASLAGQMIAAQSQLEGLRQIYTDSNPRVQSLNARVAELRRELGKLSGNKDQTTSNQSLEHLGDMPYPSIRNLPLLGVRYADLYRHAKIQETVYELLTQQAELAKVQEAKETPSVKILDPAKVPEKKSFPPRLLIIAMGTFFALAGCIVWTLSAAQWEEGDAGDPRRIFAHEVAGTLKAHTPWAASNGHGAGSKAQRIWRRLRKEPNTKQAGE